MACFNVKFTESNSKFTVNMNEYIGGGGTIIVDDELSTTSTNPVQNKVITNELNTKLDETDVQTLTNIEIQKIFNSVFKS